MTPEAPLPELDARYSEQGVTATAWKEGRDELAGAEMFWLSTVRPDGRPHVTPLLAVWLDDPRALYFCTGADERKARNLARNPHCVLTTGHNRYDAGLDVVVEGEAVQVRDEPLLRRLAEMWAAKYGPDWQFDVREGAFRHPQDGGSALVFGVSPDRAFGFSKFPFAQTRWRFGHGATGRG
jgi:nitroimidazol reductase NimA-like FMN-containing flavoprotein (pyridoxamine 5'-phosphate oxidase superfamily)